MNRKNYDEEKKIDPEIKKLVLWRIETGVPEYFKLSMGGREGTLDKEEMKRHVEAEDETGLEIVNMQLQFIRAVSSGRFSKFLAEQ